VREAALMRSLLLDTCVADSVVRHGRPVLPMK
jgi:hypothetical protein